VPDQEPSLAVSTWSAERRHFDDADATEAAIGDAFYPTRTTLSRTDGGFRANLTLHQLGACDIGEVHYNTGVMLTCPEVRDSYHLNVPLAGHLTSRSRGVQVELDAHRAALYRRDSDALVGTREPLHVLALKFDAEYIRTTLSALLGRPVDDDLRLSADIRFDHGPGREWWGLLQSVRRELARGGSLLASPLVLRPLVLALVNGFLLAGAHQYAEELRSPVSAPPGPIRQASDLVLTRLGEPITVADIAREVGVSVRALERGFLRHLGATPTQYIRRERLRRVRADLIAGDPSVTSVARIATRWGFAHLGRFSAEYRAHYGVPPSETLRS
jgi:AraC-like DNA-binding protein